MEDILVECKLTKEDKLQKQYDRALREIGISRAKAAVFKADVVSAYKILDSLKFDYLADTAFREKITKSLKSLESALRDFLLDDQYWNKREKEIRNMTVEEYDSWLKQPMLKGAQSNN